jgi:Ca-activated chloride channel family protein
VVFAGTAVVKCPLTVDYGFFRMMLDNISTESISRGGTMIGDAVRKVVNEVFDDQAREFKDIILITDGEDHDSFPVAAAEEAGKKGIRIIAIGLGDENEGMRIPIKNEKGEKTFLTYQGREVWTKLDANTLRKMAGATPGGKYLNVATGTIDLGEVYSNLVGKEEKKEFESETIKKYEEKYQIFLAIAFVLLCIELITGDREKKKVNLNSTAIFLLSLFIMMSAPFQAYAESDRELVERGNRAYAQENYDDALSAYKKANEESKNLPVINFNLGTAHYRKGELDEAEKVFEKSAVESKDTSFKAKARFNQGDTLFRKAEKLRKTDLNSALELAGKSVQYFHEALKLDPDFIEAAENIEITKLMMKSIIDEIDEKDETKKQDQEKKDSKEEDASNKPTENNGENDQESRQGDEKPGDKSTDIKKDMKKDMKKPENEKADAQDDTNDNAPEKSEDTAEKILEEEKQNIKRRQIGILGRQSGVDRDW